MSKLSSKQADEAKSLPMMNLGVELPEFDKTKYPHGGYGKLRDFGWQIMPMIEYATPDAQCRIITFDDLPAAGSSNSIIDAGKLRNPKDGEGVIFDQHLGPEYYIFGFKNGELRFGVIPEGYLDCLNDDCEIDTFYLGDDLFVINLPLPEYHRMGGDYRDFDVCTEEYGKTYLLQQVLSIAKNGFLEPTKFLEVALFRPNITQVLTSNFVWQFSEGACSLEHGNISFDFMHNMSNSILFYSKQAANPNMKLGDEDRKNYEFVTSHVCSNIGLLYLKEHYFDAVSFMLEKVSETELLSFNPPQVLADLCARMLAPEKGSIVYNPFASLGSIAVALPQNIVNGEEKDSFLGFCSDAYCFYRDANTSHLLSNVSICDPLITLTDSTKQFRYIASILPLSLKDSDRLKVLTLLLDRLDKDGTLVCVVPAAITTSTMFEPIRKRLICDKYAVDIISLPPIYEPYSSIELCLIKVKSITHDYQKHLHLTDGRGFAKHRRSSNQLLIDSLMEAVTTQTDVTISMSNEMVQDTILKPERYITLRDLPKLPRGYQYLLLKQLVSIMNDGDAFPSILLIKTVGTSLKFRKEEKASVKIPKYSIAVKVNETLITEDYLMHELQTDYVQQQFKAYATGTTVKHISNKDLLNILIAVPSIEKQHLVTEAFFKSGLEKARKDLDQAFVRYKADVHHKKHAIGQDLGELINLWENLMSVKQNGNGHLDDQMTYGTMSVAQMELRIGSIIESVRKQVDEFTITDNMKGEDRIELFSFLNCFIQSNRLPQFSFDPIECVHELRHMTISFPSAALEHVMKNIVFNAVTHGFDNVNLNEPEKNRIHIWITTDDNQALVTIANNGKPMNEKVRSRMFEYANTSARGIDGHSGIGCYQAWQLMTENGGDIQLLPAEDDFPVVFRLCFNNFNINNNEE